MRSKHAGNAVRGWCRLGLAALAAGACLAGGAVAMAQGPGMPAGGAAGGSSAAPGAGAAAKVIGIGFTVTFAVVGANYLLASAICAPSGRAERPKKRKDD